MRLKSIYSFSKKLIERKGPMKLMCLSTKHQV